MREPERDLVQRPVFSVGQRPRTSDRVRRTCHPMFGWSSLTKTESRVVDLVAEGLTNRQVAAEMYVSRHTVDFHLRQIYRKLGIRSRVQLTRLALEHALAAATPGGEDRQQSRIRIGTDSVKA